MHYLYILFSETTEMLEYYYLINKLIVHQPEDAFD